MCVSGDGAWNAWKYDAAVDDELPVRDVQQARESVAANRRQLARLRPHHGVERDGREHEEQRREQAPGPPRPERGQTDPARGLPLGEQQRGDEVAADHEEDVDAEEAALRPGDLAVVQDHGGHREGAQPVEARAVAEASGFGGGARHGLQGNEHPVDSRRTAAIGRQGNAGGVDAVVSASADTPGKGVT